MVPVLLTCWLLLLGCCYGSRFQTRGEPEEYPGTANQPQNVTSTLQLRMPGITPTKNDDYLCMHHKMDDQEYFITQFRIEGTAERAHHMLLYGCKDVPVPMGSWDCGHHGVCSDGQTILFAWAKNAPPTSLPPNVGFKIGGTSSVKYLVMQIHYSRPLPQGEKDYSGMDLTITTQPQKYAAGIFLLLTGQTVIPPETPTVHGDVNCRVTVNTPLHMFAFRTHAHALGRVITGYRYSNKTGKLDEIARGNPQWPQAFYGMSRVFDTEEGDMLFARCTFNSTGRNRTTYIGSSGSDEMCNLYIMYYTDAEKGPTYQSCGDVQNEEAMKTLPEDSDKPLPPNPLLEEHAIHGNQVNHDDQDHGSSVTSFGNRTINLEKMDYSNLFQTGDDKKSKAPTTTMKLRMPGITPTKDDDYRCMAFKMTEEELYITQFKVEGTAERAHHMLLYGCSDVPVDNGAWDCGHHGSCRGSQIILFAWAKNAPPTSLPPDVGFKIGGESRAKFLVLQIHYAHPLPNGEQDFSGMDLEVTKQPQPNIAGIYLLLTTSTIIPPHQKKVHGDINCRVKTKTPLHMFAYRTHAHALGRVITGYRYSTKTGQLEEIARGNPQWPQAFYGMSHVFDVEEGDILFGRCTFDSTHKNKTTYIGGTAGDEMCNLYLMYYTDAATGSPYESCADKEMHAASKMLPEDSDQPLPPNPLLEEHAVHGNQVQTEVAQEEKAPEQIFSNQNEEDSDLIPIPDKKGDHGAHGGRKKPMLDPNEDSYNDDNQQQADYYAQSEQPAPKKVYKDNYDVDSRWSVVMRGQPSAVAVDSKGNVVVFHRGDRAWGASTFGTDNRLTNPQQGPIKQATLMLLNPIDGTVSNEAGASMFYLPHGLTIDDHDQLWVTDVGAHQVFKLTPLTANSSSVQILIELGKQLQPGSGDGRFCKPTSVAVLPSGEFFVADGYCNSRIIKYNAAGGKIAEWGERPTGFRGNPPPNVFNVPHSLTLINEKELLCVADRENGRIQCFSSKDGQYQMQIKVPEFGETVYAIAYNAGNMFVVNGPSYRLGRTVPAQGYVIDMKETGDIISTFGTKMGGLLGQPHWIALGPNGTSVYVTDINPYRVVKYVLEGTVQTPVQPKNVTAQSAQSSSLSVETKKPRVTEMNMADLDSISFSTSLIILAIFAVPLLCIVIIASIVRLRKRGCCGKSRGNQLDIGSLLGHRDPVRGGFEKLAMEDSDGDVEIDSDSDAEVVEFTKAKRNTNLNA